MTSRERLCPDCGLCIPEDARSGVEVCECLECDNCGERGPDVVPCLKDRNVDGCDVMVRAGDLCTECMEDAGAEPEADYA